MLKKFLKRILKENGSIYRMLRQIHEELHRKYKKERLKNHGRLHPDKPFFVIRAESETGGLMSYYNSNIGWIAYALRRGWIPVIDMQNFKNPYLSEQMLHRQNAWEYYFRQPFDYVLEEVYQSRHVILSSGKPNQTASPRLQGKRLKNPQYLKKTSNIIRKYMRLNDDMKKCAEENAQKLLGGGIGIGVVSRGTDLLGYPGHSRQPETSELIHLTRDRMKKWKADFIFLATEEEKVIRQFEEEFGKGVIRYNKAEKFDDYNSRILAEVSFDREHDEFLKGWEYLITVLLLARCHYLIGTYVGASVAAVAINGGKYRDTCLIDLGIY